MTATQKTARSAGALYLFSSIAAGLPLVYANHLLVPSDAAATAKNILAAGIFFRVSIVSELVGAVAFLFMGRVLYRLMSSVDKLQASLVVTFILASIPISFLNALNEVAALALVEGLDLATGFDQSQRNALATLFLGLHGGGVSLANIFWGLWLLPFGRLVIRSGLLPRILGVLLAINGFALVAVSLTALLAPTYLDAVNRLAIPFELGELWAMTWLLIKGVKEPLLSKPPMPVPLN